MSAPPPTVSARLATLVREHRLQADDAQREAAVRLDSLGGELRARSRTPLARLQARASRWAGTARTPRGVYLWGGVGRGKTLLMDLFFAGLSQPRGSPPIAERSHFYHFMRDVHAALAATKRRSDPLDVVAERLASRCRVLCIDEFFVADIADAMILAGLLHGLFRRGVTLVATSNVPPRDLYKDGLQRGRFLPAIELLLAHVDLVHLHAGIDYRLALLERAPTYLDSALPRTTGAMQERFAALTGARTDAAAGAPADAVALADRAPLIIEGRELRAVNFRAGTAWFEFSDLCEGPRSQNDYIELARLFHTLFVSNIPVFGHDDDDAARRFIMLIDELYDRCVKVVVSAAAPPAALYRGGRLNFEFERAASRLIEMQTQRYLAGRHRP